MDQLPSMTMTCSCRAGSAGRNRPAATAWSSSASGTSCSRIPAYDAFWRDQAVDKVLAKQPLTVPVMLVHSLWDQEDIYGALAVYKAIKPKDTRNDMVIWSWALGITVRRSRTAARSAPIRFGSDTAPVFPRADIASFPGAVSQGRCTQGRPRSGHRVSRPARISGGGSTVGRWLRKRLPGRVVPLYLRAGRKASFDRAELAMPATRRIRLRSRQARALSRAADPADRIRSWADLGAWLVDDQREASGRTDVLTFTTEVLTSPSKISGKPEVQSGCLHQRHGQRLGGQTDRRLSGRGAPDSRRWAAISWRWRMDILRGRYRESFVNPKPIEPNKPLPYRFAPADGQPRVPAGAPHHGAGAVELVSALRPQSADLRAQHLLCQACAITVRRRSGSTTPRQRRLT